MNQKIKQKGRKNKGNKMTTQKKNTVDTKQKELGFVVPNVSDQYELTKEAYLEIYRIVNRRRPYCPSDFIPQPFFPDLDQKTR